MRAVRTLNEGFRTRFSAPRVKMSRDLVTSRAYDLQYVTIEESSESKPVRTLSQRDKKRWVPARVHVVGSCAMNVDSVLSSTLQRESEISRNEGHLRGSELCLT